LLSAWRFGSDGRIEHRIKVVLALLPALVVAATGTFVTILFGLKGETRSVVFPAVVVFEKTSKRPLGDFDAAYNDGQPDWPLTWLVSSMTAHDPALCAAEPAEIGINLYFDLMLKLIVSRLFQMYHFGWDINVRRVDAPLGFTSADYAVREPTPDADFVTLDDLKSQFPEVKTLSYAGDMMPDSKLAVPPGTRILGKNDVVVAGNVLKRTLSLTNNFVSVTISIEKSMGTSGVGSLARLLGYSEEFNDRFWTVEYVINLRAN
jgi:hypothetical protein